MSNNTFYLDTPNGTPRPETTDNFPTVGSILEDINLSMSNVIIRITNGGVARDNVDMGTAINAGDSVTITMASNKSGK